MDRGRVPGDARGLYGQCYDVQGNEERARLCLEEGPPNGLHSRERPASALRKQRQSYQRPFIIWLPNSYQPEDYYCVRGVRYCRGAGQGWLDTDAGEPGGP